MGRMVTDDPAESNLRFADGVAGWPYIANYAPPEPSLAVAAAG